MTTNSYWSGSTLVLDWALTDPDGNTVVDADVTGEVRQPDGAVAVLAANWNVEDQVYRATFTPTQPGLHVWRLEAAGTATGAIEGSVVVQRSLLGLPPITVDPTTTIGQVRLLATDVDEVDPLFTDAQIQAFLTLEGGRVRRAAAQALDTIASSEAMVSKKIRATDITTDGPAVAKELRGRAASLRQQDDQTDDDGGTWGLDIVEFDQWAAYRTPEGV